MDSNILHTGEREEEKSNKQFIMLSSELYKERQIKFYNDFQKRNMLYMVNKTRCHKSVKHYIYMKTGRCQFTQQH